MMLAAGSASASPQAPEYVCSRTTGPIALDGVLNDPAWAGAKVIDGFMTLGPRGEKAKNPARVRVLFDNKFLYIGGDLTTLPGKMPLTLKQSKRDYAVWGNDCIDIFLQPREGQPITYQLMVSAHGHLYDAQNKPGVAKPELWNGQIEVKAKQRLGGWSFEMAVPFADLGRKPFRGDVWVFRMGVAANGYEMAMWPHNRELSFHNKACRAYLIFEDRNLLSNGDFETLPDKPGKPSPGWRFIINTKPNTPGQGTIRLVTLPDAPQGPHVAELDKTDQPGYWPALVVDRLPVEPGATYDFSAFVKAEKPFYAGAGFVGPETKDPRHRFYIKGARKYPASQEFRKIIVRHPGDDRVRTGGVLFRYEGEQGKLWVDGVSLRRVNGLVRAGQTVKEADPIHNLVELSARTHFKPFDLLKRPDGWYQGGRTVFKDSGTGATIWKMSHHPGYICRQQYMERSPWNCNGEWVIVYALPQWWHILMKPDGSAWKPMMYYSTMEWDRLDSDLVWLTKGGNTLAKYSAKTGEATDVQNFQGHVELWRGSRDGKYQLAKEILTVNGKTTSRIHLIPRDITPGGAGIITLDPGEQIHQLWFTNRPDYSVVFGYEDYLKGGAVMTPDGKIVKNIKYGAGMMPGGHHAPSPSGKWAVSPDGFIYDWLTEEIQWISDHRTNHQSWGPDGTWFVGSAGFDMRRFGIPPKRFDQLLGAANSMLKYGMYWAEEHPVVSPDGTKSGYASNMLGYVEFYVVITRLPEAPVHLRAAQKGESVHLEWQSPKQSKECALYRIHHADAVSGPYKPVATVPSGTTSRDLTNPRRGHFVVTSQEYSGLESNYSNAASVGSAREPFLASAEAESGVYGAPGEELFDPTAANLYAVSLGTQKPCDGLTLAIPVSREIKGSVFARIRSTLLEGESTVDLYVNGEKAGSVAVKKNVWHWLELNQDKPIRLKPSLASVKLVPVKCGIVVDQVVIVDDRLHVLKGVWGRDELVPRPVTRLRGQPIDPYTVRLAWVPTEDKDIAHYNVYAARGSDCKPGNETLIVSPAEPDVLDWGLMANTQYAYRVTAVDRAGNESAPSEPLTMTTPPVKERVFIRHPCSLRTKGQAKLQVPFHLEKAGEILVWIRARCFNQKPVARFKVLLDDKQWREPYHIPWYFITPHHPGPVKDVWLWAYIDNLPKGGASGKRRLLPAPAGKRTLTLVPDESFIKRYGAIDVEFGEVIITNDLGYVPPGITNFLIDPMRGRGKR